MELKVILDDRTIDQLAEKLAALIGEPKVLSYTAEDLAEKLHTYPQKINQWRREGRIKGIKKGAGWIYRPEEVDRFLRSREGVDD